MSTPSNEFPRTVFVAGATGSLGGTLVRELVQAGYSAVALARQLSGELREQEPLSGAEIRVCDVCDPDTLAGRAFHGEKDGVVISCLRGCRYSPVDAWRVDHQANLNLLEAARTAGISRFIYVSSIAVQKPELGFLQARLAFESALADSGLHYSIIRPSAEFSSLIDQVERVKRGGRYRLFGDGNFPLSKPISREDLSRFIIDCIEDGETQGRVLPVGGPGPALTSREQGELLYSVLGKKPRFRGVSLRRLERRARRLSLLARVIPGLGDKAEAARVEHYFASEPALPQDEADLRYDADAMPEYGRDSLEDLFRRTLARDHS
jgi:divinyl chlorophyllide a 8-vinyl-reductase